MATVINDPIIARKVSVISGIGKALVFIGVICAVIGGIVAAVTHFLG